MQDLDTRKAIIKGQCLNIAFQEFNISDDKTEQRKEMKERIQCTHEIYNELMLQNFISW